MVHIYEIASDEEVVFRRILERMEYSIVSFSVFTGVPVTLVSPAFEILWEISRAAKVCSTHASNLESCLHCWNKITVSLEQAAENGGRNMFLCNSGLVNLCYVLRYQNRIRGYLIAGPVAMGRDRDQTLIDFYDKARPDKVDLPQMMAMMRNLDVFTPERVEGMGQVFHDVVTAAYVGEEDGPAFAPEPESWEKERLARFAYHGRSNVIFNAVRFIREHYRTISSLSEVAEYVRVTRSYLSTLFKKEMGMSIVDYVNDMRLTAAEWELCNTGRSITEIALSVGYREPSYFSRLFKKKYGVNPREFRDAAADGMEGGPAGPG